MNNNGTGLSDTRKPKIQKQLRENKEAGFAAENKVVKFNTIVDNIKTKLDNYLSEFTASLKNNKEATKAMPWLT